MKHKSLSNTYIAMFCTELAMLLQAGIPFGDSILMLQDDEPEANGKAVLQRLLDSLDDGGSVAEAFRESGYFPKYMVSMIEIGERTGRVVDTLEALSEYYNRQDRLSVVIKNAVIYPAILLVLMVTVVLILIIRVLPMFNDVFGSLGSQMSPLAVGLMRFGVWLGNISTVIAVIIAAVVVLVLAAWLITPIRAAFASFFKNHFEGRGVWGRIASSRFTSALALSSASGLNTEEAVEMASSIGGGSKTLDAMHSKCLEMLRSGSTLAEALSQTGIISARDGRMLSTGARSGMEDTAMAEIASRGSRNVQDEIDRLIGKIEPTLVIITSMAIGVILLSVMLPLMGIMSSIG